MFLGPLSLAIILAAIGSILARATVMLGAILL